MGGKRPSAVKYRTVDGNHPAPFPDMTDEQLYNYEMAFNVPRKTFDKPPRPAQPEPAAHSEEKTARNEKVFDAPRYTARATRPEPPASDAALPPLDLSKPVRLVTTRQPVEIITTRARHPVYKVHGYIGNDDVVTVFTLDGRLSEHGLRYLENVPSQQELHLNIYANPEARGADRYIVTQHETREAADAAVRPGRLACVAVQFDPDSQVGKEERHEAVPS